MSKKRAKGLRRVGAPESPKLIPLTPAHHAIEEITVDVPGDSRPHVEVLVNHIKVTALLDSGANICIIGKGGEYLVENARHQINQSPIVVKTADGTSHVPTGCIVLPVQFLGTIRRVAFQILSSVQRPLLLGMNFWRVFNLGITNIKSIREINEINQAHTLTEQHRKQLEEVVKEFPFTSPGRLNFTPLIEHHIETGSSPGVRQRPHIHSPYIQELVLEEVDRLLDLDIIEKCGHSKWCNPVIPVKKASGKVRLCLDARKLNEATVKSAYPVQSMNRILAQLRGTVYLSAIDLTDAYYQIRLNESSRDKTTFAIISRGTYRYKRMPMGLCNSGATLCQLVDALFGSRFEPYAFPYLDDFIVATDTFDKHLEILRAIAEMLRGANLTVSETKSRFCMARLKYLGYILDGEGLRPDPENIRPILEYSTPSTVKQVRSLLGMLNWFRRFIKSFSSIVSPISDLLKKKHARFQWTPEANEAFEKVKVALVSAPVLTMPDYTVPFEIHCDASDLGIGAILTQEYSDSSEGRVVAYHSEKLNDAQRNYHTTEKECLAVLKSIQKFRIFIEGTRFTVYTDHAALQWLRNLKDPTGRLARWVLQLQDYDFQIIHRKGRDMAVPDALSRNILILDDALLSRLADNDYQRLRSRIQAGEMPEKFKIVNDLVHQKGTKRGHPVGRILVPSNFIEEIIRAHHDHPTAAHGGFSRTLDRINRRYIWAQMAASIRKYVSKCEVCKGVKPDNALERAPMGQSRLPDAPWQLLALDFVGPLPLSKSRNRWLLVIMDNFSKFVILKAMRTASAENTAKFLENEVFLRYGVPERITSDQGCQFRSKIFADLCDKCGIRWRPTPAYYPQANPTEAANKTVMNAVRSYIKDDGDHDSWDVHL